MGDAETGHARPMHTGTGHAIMLDQTLPLSTQQTDEALESWAVMLAQTTTVDAAMTLADLAESFARRWQQVADDARQHADTLIEERD